MSACQSSELRSLARAVGTVGIGTFFGLAMSIPLLNNPVLSLVKGSKSSKEDLKARLAFWSKQFDVASKRFPPFLVASSAGFLITSFLRNPHQPSRLFLTLSFFAFSIGPFTKFAILPVVARLKELEDTFTKGEEDDLRVWEEEVRETESLLKQWDGLHLVRIAVAGVVFAISALF